MNMNKVLTILAVLLISAAGVSAQNERTPSSKKGAGESAVVVKRASFGDNRSSHSKPGVVEIGPRTTFLKEGLSLAAVLHVLGQPSAITERIVDEKVVRSYEFSRGAGRTVVADFVNDILVHSQTVSVENMTPRVAG